MSNAYKRSHGGHDYLGRTEGRGGRKDNKLKAALKGIASYDLLNQVAAEDEKRRRERSKSCISS
jgi:hypothetical protein